MNIKDISSKDWQIKLNAPGEVVEGVDDVNQCIYIILVTEKGSDPLRPEFGCGALSYIDKPSTVAVPNMIREIFDALELWEPRATVTRIVPEIDEANVRFLIYWRESSASAENIQSVNYGFR